MNELRKHASYQDKLKELCADSNLTYSLRRDRYPFALTIKPIGGMGAQLSMLENDTANYISPDASIVFAFVDGDLTMRTSETFTIGDALLSKIKRLFANLYATWTQFCFRDTMERGLQPSAAADPQRDSEATPEAADEADFDEFFKEDPDGQDGTEE